MTAAALFVAYVGGIALLGYVLLCLCRRSAEPLHPTGILANSWILGSGALGLLLFCLSLAGLKPTRTILSVVLVLAGGSLLLLVRKRLTFRPPTPARLPTSAVAPALAALVLIPCAWALLEALGAPFTNIDAVAIWGFKAKVLSTAPISQADYFTDITKSFTHLDYPLLLPFVTAGAYAAIGHVHEPLAKALSVLYLGALLLLLCQWLRETLSARLALLLCAIYAASTALLTQGSAGIADLALMAYYLAAVFWLIRAMANGRCGEWILAALLSVSLLFTKNEGLALAASNALVAGAWTLLARPTRWRPLLWAISGALLLSLPWLVFRSALPHTDEDYIGRLQSAAVLGNVQRLPLILRHFAASMAEPGPWGGIWFLLLLGLLSSRLRDYGERLLVLWALLFAHLSCYVLALLVTPWDVRELLGMKAVPLLLQASPVAMLIIGQYLQCRMQVAGVYGAAPDNGKGTPPGPK